MLSLTTYLLGLMLSCASQVVFTYMNTSNLVWSNLKMCGGWVDGYYWFLQAPSSSSVVVQLIADARKKILNSMNSIANPKVSLNKRPTLTHVLFIYKSVCDDTWWLILHVYFVLLELSHGVGNQWFCY